MREGLFHRALSLWHVLLLGCVLPLSGVTAAEKWHPPDLSNIRIKATVEYDQHTGVYRYEYEIDHPVINRGGLRRFSLATDIPFPYGEYIDKELLEQSGVSGKTEKTCDSPLASGVASVVCAESAPGWEVGGLKNSVEWIGMTAWGKPLAKTSPGRVRGGFVIYTRVPPGAVVATLTPKVDTSSPASPYQIYGERCGEDVELCPDIRSFNLKYPTVGPVAPKK